MDKFSPSELHIADLQFLLTHKRNTAFELGELVFVKCNPEWPLEVVAWWNDNLVCLLTPEGSIEKLPPEILLQYKYRALVVYKKTWNICLN